MIAAESAISVTILPVSVAAIFDAPNSADLFRANAEECLVPDADPQRAIYEAMEQTGVIRCFAACLNDSLIGFAALLLTPMPDHPGKCLATIKNIFVDPAYRSTGAGDLLLDAADRFTEDYGCIGITGVAIIGSRLEKVLSRRAGYRQTHSVFTRRLP
jgi:GNAT superfamily N-acetyltransferase